MPPSGLGLLCKLQHTMQYSTMQVDSVSLTLWTAHNITQYLIHTAAYKKFCYCVAAGVGACGLLVWWMG